MKHHRLARVAEAIREAASEAILFELKDPRVKFTTVTRAEVSADLQHAKVYVSVMGTDQEQEQCLDALRRSAGFVQRQLADRLKTRFTPTLQFVQDKGVKNSLVVTQLQERAQAAGKEAERLAEAQKDDGKALKDLQTRFAVVEDRVTELKRTSEEKDRRSQAVWLALLACVLTLGVNLFLLFLKK